MTLVGGLVLASCEIALPGSDAKQGGNSATGAPGAVPQSIAGASKTATIELEKGGIITIGLFGGNDPKSDAPSTIKNFEAKANQGFYNGLVFHRVEDWVVQGGDPKGDGTGGGQMASEYNEREFRVGAVGIARGGDPRLNNDSQFFIVKRDSPHLNKMYTNFGQVTSGLEQIVKIAIGDKIKKITVK
ncbi:MAG: peptidylprolyl isomerase [Chloroflexi bacterium]|nr:peptidylprolyl isomerase [Chloroflexota bacterium]